jgi:hypothetical protein
MRFQGVGGEGCKAKAMAMTSHRMNQQQSGDEQASKRAVKSDCQNQPSEVWQPPRLSHIVVV